MDPVTAIAAIAASHLGLAAWSGHQRSMMVDPPRLPDELAPGTPSITMWDALGIETELHLAEQTRHAYWTQPGSERPSHHSVGAHTLAEESAMLAAFHGAAPPVRVEVEAVLLDPYSISGGRMVVTIGVGRAHVQITSTINVSFALVDAQEDTPDLAEDLEDEIHRRVPALDDPLSHIPPGDAVDSDFTVDLWQEPDFVLRSNSFTDLMRQIEKRWLYATKRADIVWEEVLETVKACH